MESANKNPLASCIKEFTVSGTSYKYFSLAGLNDQRVNELPFSIKILLEQAVRNCDEFNVKKADVEKILDWKNTQKLDVEIPFKPARVILQDFTGVPLVVDLAAMRDAMKRLGGEPKKINPLCQVDLVIDHSIMVHHAKTLQALEQNQTIEFNDNKERFEFLKWGQGSFENLKIVPPGSGIVHQVNLEYLAKGVFTKDGFVYPDTVVGTDSHTTMINGLGVLGWGVGGIEAESNMLGECSAMVLPEVIGFKLTGSLPRTSTATDLVLTCTAMLRKRGVVSKFVEFFGSGCCNLTLADRATIANMAPEYGATTGFFPVDSTAIAFLRQTGRDEKQVKLIEAYLKANGLFRYYDGSQPDPVFSGEVLELDLGTVVPCLAGPKRPMDRVPLSNVQKEFQEGLCRKVDFKSFGLPEEKRKMEVEFDFHGEKYTFKNGAVMIAAITSCTNTSNPGVMLAAGILARNAVNAGLKVPAYVKTSLSPGSQVATKYFEEAGLTQYLNQLGFCHAGYGCMTCIGNSGDIDPILTELITKHDFVASAVLSGNRNFEGRVHPLTKANYLASPPLVVAYALAGTVDIDFDTQPLGTCQQGSKIFLRDIWPKRDEVEKLAAEIIKPAMFQENYAKIAKGTDAWNSLAVKEGFTYEWKNESTYIHNPPFFQTCDIKPAEVKDINNAYCLGLFGDSITTDHISPAGNITASSPAGKFLQEHGVKKEDFNSYGSRRGNDEVMNRGTFANTRIINKMMKGVVGPKTVYVPSGEEMYFYDAAMKYRSSGFQIIVIGGKEYGTGSSRDWAAKGPFLQGISAVIAESFERIHRSNLVGMGILPLEFKNGETADKLGLTGAEKFTIQLHGGNLKTKQDVEVTTDKGLKFTTTCRLDTDVEVNYFKQGGILLYVLRKLATGK